MSRLCWIVFLVSFQELKKPHLPQMYYAGHFQTEWLSEYKNAVATNDLCSLYTGSWIGQRGGVRVLSTINVAVFSSHSTVGSCVTGSDRDCIFAAYHRLQQVHGLWMCRERTHLQYVLKVFAFLSTVRQFMYSRRWHRDPVSDRVPSRCQQFPVGVNSH